MIDWDFLGWARHTQELDNIADGIAFALGNGINDFSTKCFDTLTKSDLEYIEIRLKKCGFVVSLTLD